MNNRPPNNTNRRGLFALGLRTLRDNAEQVVKAAIAANDAYDKEVANEKVDYVRRRDISRKALRPPGALPETEFLRLCDQCGDCYKACPENTLLPDTTAASPDEAYPVFDPRRKACYLCTDLHCIVVCKPGALVRPEKIADLKMGVARIDPASCLAATGSNCHYCVDFCPLAGTAIELQGGLPIIDATACVGCGLCEYYCRVHTGREAIVTLPSGR